MVEEDSVSRVVPVEDALDILLILTDPLSEVSMSSKKKKYYMFSKIQNFVENQWFLKVFLHVQTFSLNFPVF